MKLLAIIVLSQVLFVISLHSGSFSGTASAADITAVTEKDPGKLSSRVLLIEGDIETGDSDKVLRAISGDVSSGPVLRAEIASRGGNLIEGLKISALLNDALIAVVPAALEGENYCAEDWVSHIENCYCQSACAFIWMAAARREWSAQIGIHSPFLNQKTLSKKELQEAELDFSRMVIWLREYLTSQQVPSQMIDLALQYRSNEMRILTDREVAEFPRVKPVLYEYLNARCFDKPGVKQRLEYDRDVRKAYADGDTAALLLLGALKNDEVMALAYSRCLTVEIYRLALDRQKNIFDMISRQCEFLPGDRLLGARYVCSSREAVAPLC